MGQVPEKNPYFSSFHSSKDLRYGIVGSGRVATHMCRYLDLLKITFRHWYRGMEKSLEDVLGGVPVVLLLIKDSEIEKFVASNPFLKEKILIHFSGSLVTPLAQGFHPLMTFSTEPYALAEYERIPFVVEKGLHEFKEIFPRLRNPHYALSTDQKGLYHALCVLSGNFTTILWDKLFKELESRLGMPRDVAFPYLDRIVENLKRDSGKALTGPLARGDGQTISNNLNALKNDPFQGVYEAFVEAWKTTKKENFTC